MPAAVRYHVTVLSNFARGYDKYVRRYSKDAIPESTFPGQFFLLPREELAIGIRKAARLMDKLALTDNRLIALETAVEEADLRDNDRTGLGQYVASAAIRLHALHQVMEEGSAWQLEPLCIEEATAMSLRLLHPRFLPFAQLQPRTFSVLPIAKGCQAACPFCFSDASVSAIQEQAKLPLPHVEAFARAARRCGAERFVITGGGEPGLVPHRQLTDFIRLGARELGKTVLITNGHHLTKLDPPVRVRAMADYAEAGLTVLAVSRHHHDDAVNGRLMNLLTPASEIAATWHQGRDRWPELRLRFTCVLQQGGVDSLESLCRYVDWATALGVTEICCKELYVSTSVESVYHSLAANAWSHQHQVPLAVVLAFAQQHGLKEVCRLPWGAPVFQGAWRGRPLQVAAYTEPSLFWERTHGIARSWNLMADGRCLASLEDRGSEIPLAGTA